MCILYGNVVSKSFNIKNYKKEKTLMKKILTILSIVVLLGFLVPSSAMIPVYKAACNDWNPKTFWFEPWGSSGVHKGIDIFAKKHTPVISATSGLIIFRGNIGKGGNVVLAIGPKWRLHYYAHLNSISDELGYWVNKGEKLGSVGNSGNAMGKPAHLHYSVVSLMPYPWRITDQTQGWRKMFYMNPADEFESCL